jgi:hypothetical protein
MRTIDAMRKLKAYAGETVEAGPGAERLVKQEQIRFIGEAVTAVERYFGGPQGLAEALHGSEGMAAVISAREVLAAYARSCDFRARESDARIDQGGLSRVERVAMLAKAEGAERAAHMIRVYLGQMDALGVEA